MLSYSLGEALCSKCIQLRRVSEMWDWAVGDLTMDTCINVDIHRYLPSLESGYVCVLVGVCECHLREVSLDI
jgi:hypothetical protein